MNPTGLFLIRRIEFLDTISDCHFYLYSDHLGFRLIYIQSDTEHQELLKYLNTRIEQMITQSYYQLFEDFYADPFKSWQFESYLTI